MCDKTSAEKAESTKLNKEKYPYFVDNFSDDGFAPVRKFSDNEIYDNYFVDRDYKVYKKSGEEYTIVIDKMYGLSKADAPLHITGTWRCGFIK